MGSAITIMLTIRFTRTGKKNQPFFRIVVCDKRNAPRGGRNVEVLGFYNPKTKETKVDADRAKYWISMGAQPSATVHNLLVKQGILKAEKIANHKKSKKPAEAKPAAVAPVEVEKPVEAEKPIEQQSEKLVEQS